MSEPRYPDAIEKPEHSILNQVVASRFVSNSPKERAACAELAELRACHAELKHLKAMFYGRRNDPKMSGHDMGVQLVLLCHKWKGEGEKTE